MKQVLVNIPSYVEDSSYRYKMPKPQLKIEGKGNGIRTNIVNLHEIAKALNCPDQYPLKYLGYEFGSSTIYKFKNDNDVTCIMCGAFQDEAIRKTLDKFIEKYILCQKCKYPEMYIKIKGKQFVGQCDACSHVSDLDNTHRLASYIFKNPPENKASIKNKEEIQQQFAAALVASEATKQKKKKITGAELTLGSEQLGEFLKVLQSTYQQLVDGEELISVDSADIMLSQEIKQFHMDKILVDRVCYLLFQCMFNENPVNQLERNYEVLTKLMSEVDPEHYDCHMILNIQHLMKRFSIEDKYFPTILKGFYDYSYIEDTFLVKWHENSQEWISEKMSDFLYEEELDNKCREIATPFIQWVKLQMESQEEEEESA